MNAISEALDALREAIGKAIEEKDEADREDRREFDAHLSDFEAQMNRLADAVEKQGRILADVEFHLRQGVRK